MSALRICPGCGDRRILLTVGAGQRLCVDCRDQAQGRLFTREATLEDLDLSADASHRVGLPGETSRALGCRCDRPLTDSDGDCVRCGRWAAA